MEAINDGYFSIIDTIGEILENDTAAQIVLDAIAKATGMKAKKTMLGMMSGMKLEDMAGMLGGQNPDNSLFNRINAELQKVKK